MVVTDAKPLLNHDQLIVIEGTWEHFRLIQQGLEQSSGAKLSYYNGVIEILMPGRAHELFAELIGHLVVIFLSRKGIFFVPTGSMDQAKEGQASTQADKSYCIGSSKPIPDLSIEVVFSSGSISKLARYQNLEVPEVWFWQDGTLSLYHLRQNGYEQITQSELEGLKDLNFDLLKRCILMGETNAGEAIRVFSEGII